MWNSCTAKELYQRPNVIFAILAAGCQVMENSWSHDGTVFILRLADRILNVKSLSTPEAKWMNEVIIIMAFYSISEYNNAEKLLRSLEIRLLVSLFYIPVSIIETAGLYGQEKTTSKKEAKNWQEKPWKIELILRFVPTEVVVQSLSHVRLFATPWTAACQASCPSLSPRVCSHSCELCWWCHIFAAGGQTIGALA